MNKIKALVSKKKRRFQKDGFDLDLSYVTDRLIAMGFPSEGVEGMYRNDMEHVRKFLQKFHDRHYKIYNLCSERAYPPKLFRNCYAAYPFDDHGPCSFEMLLDFCEDAYKYLQRDKQNIIVAHCKAGKGRTGTVLAALLLFDKTWSTAAEALQYFAVARTANQKGVTIPSQVRYVHYMEKYLKCYRYVDRPFNFAGKPMRLVGFCLMHLGRECTPWFVVTKEGDYELCNFRKENKQLQTWSKDSPVHLLRCDVVIEADTHVLFYVGDLKKKKKKKLCGFWINTSFVHSTKMLFTKDELDVANKDKSCPKNFQVEVFFAPLPGTKNVFTCTCNSPNPCHPGYDGAELIEFEREPVSLSSPTTVSSPVPSEKESKGKGKAGLKNLSTPFTPKHPTKGEPFTETVPKGGMQNSERVTGNMLPAVMGSMNLPKAPVRAPPVVPPSAMSSEEVTKNSTLAPQLDDFYAYVRRATEAPTKPESKYAQTRCAEKGCEKERAPMGGAYCETHRPTSKSPPPLKVGAPLSSSPKGVTPTPISPKPVITPTTTSRTVQFQPPSSPVKGTQAPPPGSKIPLVKATSKSEIVPSSPTPEEDKKKEKGSRISALFGTAKPAEPTTTAPSAKTPAQSSVQPGPTGPPMPRRAPPGPPPARPPPASPTEDEDYEPPNEEEDDDEPEPSSAGSPGTVTSSIKPTISVDEDDPPPPPPGEEPEGEEDDASENEEEDVTDED